MVPIFRSSYFIRDVPLNISNSRVYPSPNVQNSTQNVRVLCRSVQVDSRMIDVFLKKVQDRVCSPSIQLNFIPKMNVEVIFEAKEVILVYILANEFLGESVIEFVVALFGGMPLFWVEGKGIEHH